MKLNNKGFALTSIIYMLIVLFLLLLLLILSNLASRKVVLDKLKYDVKNKFGQGGIQAPIGKKVGEIISSEVTTFGDGLYASTIDEGRYIYRGVNPNNYIWLDENGDGERQDDELYRIISFESDGTTKVIRNNSIGNMAWDSRTSETTGHRKNADNSYCDHLNKDDKYLGCNTWGTQSNTYMGEFTLDAALGEFKYKYYSDNNPETILQYHSNKGNVTEEASLNILLNNDWISNLDNNVRNNYVVDHLFNVGVIYYFNYYNDYVGGDKGIKIEKEEQNAYTWTGKMGLINITDMVESSLNTSCTSVWSNYRNNNEDSGTSKNWPCGNDNWLFKGINEWTVSLDPSSTSLVWSVNSNGFFDLNNAFSLKGVRPSFYLKSSLTLSGDGSIGNPYKIVS